jgi:GntR family transcriptional regulator, transcriptional repressor for pyruvate dehydrogenase complex
MSRPVQPPSRYTRHGTLSSGSIAIRSDSAVARPLKTAETVARDVARTIISSGLMPGDSMPQEAAMLESYKVSRESLREGLRLLEVQGLISIRRGPAGGPTVGHVDPGNLGRTATLYYHMAGATYSELFEAWIFAETVLAGRAAAHPDVSLRRTTMKPFFVGHPQADEVDDFVLTHTEFHSAVASLAGNRVFELMLSTMGLIVSHHVLSTYDPRTMQEQLEDEHRDIADAIVMGKVRKARQLMEEHIGGVAAVTRAYMGESVDDFIEWQ